MRKDLGVGVVLVLLGAACYGMLSTFVKLAYVQGYSPAEVLTSQFVTGFAVLGIIQLMTFRRQGAARTPISPNDMIKLIIGGSSIGFTGTFYYLSVSYTSVSAATPPRSHRCRIWAAGCDQLYGRHVVLKEHRHACSPSQSKLSDDCCRRDRYT